MTNAKGEMCSARKTVSIIDPGYAKAACRQAWLRQHLLLSNLALQLKSSQLVTDRQRLDLLAALYVWPSVRDLVG